jgi:hypothetical protein
MDKANVPIIQSSEFGGLFYFCRMIYKTTGLLIAIIFVSCGSGGYTKATDAQDAGREFIRASLDGDYRKAEFYLLKDDDNQRLFEKNRSDYQHLSADAKRSYREANIRPVTITPVNDSLTTYTYWHTSNTKDTFTLSIVRIKDEWLVDLKSIIERR